MRFSCDVGVQPTEKYRLFLPIRASILQTDLTRLIKSVDKPRIADEKGVENLIQCLLFAMI